MATDDSLALGNRAGLPDALRALVEAFPRADWEAHPHFDGMVRFWLERHILFRRILEAIRTDAEARVGHDLSEDTQLSRLSRLGGMFVGELHTHHQIEDHHYFPVLARLEPTIAHGFDLLDSDHHAIDGVLERFVAAANGLIGARGDPVLGHSGALRLHDELAEVHRFLDRHLLDEEELVVPVILKHGPDAIGH